MIFVKSHLITEFCYKFQNVFLKHAMQYLTVIGPSMGQAVDIMTNHQFRDSLNLFDSNRVNMWPLHMESFRFQMKVWFMSSINSTFIDVCSVMWVGPTQHFGNQHNGLHRARAHNCGPSVDPTEAFNFS